MTDRQERAGRIRTDAMSSFAVTHSVRPTSPGPLYRTPWGDLAQGLGFIEISHRPTSRDRGHCTRGYENTPEHSGASAVSFINGMTRILFSG
jgi:hypothetical protein